MPGGRPATYDPKLCETAYAMSQQGATVREIAQAFEVSEGTVYRWQHEHPEFRESMKLGKDAADNRVEHSLYRRAIGYSFDAIKIMQFNGIPVVEPYVEHVPPDVGAAALWLKNRRPDVWREKQEINHTGDFTVRAASLSDEQLASIAVGGANASRSDQT